MILGAQRSLYSRRNSKRSRDVDHAGMFPHLRRYKTNACIPSRKLRVEILKILVTLLLSEVKDFTLVPQNNYSRIFPPRLLHSIWRDVSCALCPAELYAIGQRPHQILGLLSLEPTLMITCTL